MGSGKPERLGRGPNSVDRGLDKMVGSAGGQTPPLRNPVDVSKTRTASVAKTMGVQAAVRLRTSQQSHEGKGAELEVALVAATEEVGWRASTLRVVRSASPRYCPCRMIK